MSAAPALPPRAPRAPRRQVTGELPQVIPPRPVLKVVKTPQRARSRGPLVVGCMTVLGGSLLATLLLNTAMAADAYELRTLQAQVAQLAVVEQDLSDQVQAIASPANLAAAASALGMVEVHTPVYIRLADHTLIGVE